MCGNIHLKRRYVCLNYDPGGLGAKKWENVFNFSNIKSKSLKTSKEPGKLRLMGKLSLVGYRFKVVITLTPEGKMGLIWCRNLTMEYV